MKKINEDQRNEYYKMSNWCFDKQFEKVKLFVCGTIIYLLCNPSQSIFWYFALITPMITMFLDFLEDTVIAHLYEKCGNEYKEIDTPNWLGYMRNVRYGTLIITIVSLIILNFTI